MVVFYKLCRITRSSRVQETESVSVMGHTWSVCSTGSDQRQWSFCVHSEARYCQMAMCWGTQVSDANRYSCCSDHFGAVGWCWLLSELAFRTGLVRFFSHFSNRNRRRDSVQEEMS